MGTKTMLMQMVDTKGRTAICWLRPGWPDEDPCPCPSWRQYFDLDRGVVDEDAEARARPPRVMMLMVSPSALRMRTEVRIESGMEMQMISVLRQLRERRV